MGPARLLWGVACAVALGWQAAAQPQVFLGWIVVAQVLLALALGVALVRGGLFLAKLRWRRRADDHDKYDDTALLAGSERCRFVAARLAAGLLMLMPVTGLGAMLAGLPLSAGLLAFGICMAGLVAAPAFRLGRSLAAGVTAFAPAPDQWVTTPRRSYKALSHQEYIDKSCAYVYSQPQEGRPGRDFLALCTRADDYWPDVSVLPHRRFLGWVVAAFRQAVGYRYHALGAAVLAWLLAVVWPPGLLPVLPGPAALFNTLTPQPDPAADDMEHQDQPAPDKEEGAGPDTQRDAPSDTDGQDRQDNSDGDTGADGTDAGSQDGAGDDDAADQGQQSGGSVQSGGDDSADGDAQDGGSAQNDAGQGAQQPNSGADGQQPKDSAGPEGQADSGQGAQPSNAGPDRQQTPDSAGKQSQADDEQGAQQPDAGGDGLRPQGGARHQPQADGGQGEQGADAGPNGQQQHDGMDSDPDTAQSGAAPQEGAGQGAGQQPQDDAGPGEAGDTPDTGAEDTGAGAGESESSAAADPSADPAAQGGEGVEPGAAGPDGPGEGEIAGVTDQPGGPDGQDENAQTPVADIGAPAGRSTLAPPPTDPPSGATGSGIDVAPVVAAGGAEGEGGNAIETDALNPFSVRATPPDPVLLTPPDPVTYPDTLVPPPDPVQTVPSWINDLMPIER